MSRLVALSFLTAVSVFAQVDAGAISGIVSDPTGAAVPSAVVTITQSETQLQTRVNSNETGQYVAPLLRPGVYSLSVDAPGFKRVTRDGILVQVQDRVRVDFALEVGQNTETVQVTAEAPIVESETSSTGAVI